MPKENTKKKTRPFSSNIYELHRLLSGRRLPIPIADLSLKLECSERTVKRAIEILRDRFDAPIEWTDNPQGYLYKGNQKKLSELPGIWFNDEELLALLTVSRLLGSLENSYIKELIDPAFEKIDSLLQEKNELSGNIADRIRIISSGSRKIESTIFQKVATAVLQQKQISVEYHSRASNESTQRTLSPQRLLYYRSNWYLDAWCHKRNGIRCFSLDRIDKVTLFEEDAKFISAEELDQHFKSSFGIYAGEAKAVAKLQFSERVAPWIKGAHWHTKQVITVQNDGSVIMEIPYSDSTEIEMEVLRYGANVKVLEPDSLKQSVKKQLVDAAEQYT